MANFLVSTMPAAGHVGPALPVVSTLVERGHHVWWHTGSAYAERVQAIGATFVAMQHAPSFEQLPPWVEGAHGPGAINAGIRRLFVDRMLGQLRDYRAIVDRIAIDVVLVDLCSLGAQLLHETGGPPWASMGISPLNDGSPDAPPWGSGLRPATTMLGRARNGTINWLATHVLLRGATVAYNKQRAQAGIRPIPRGTTMFDMLLSPFLHLQATTAGFEYPRRHLARQIFFVGALLPPPATPFTPPSWWGELSGKRVVHVTQGTVATDAADLAVPALRGLVEENVLVVVTTPDPAALGPLPANARVAPYIPHVELLPLVDVMVTNGGYGGVQAALTNGVPLVAAGGSEDKPEVAARIAWTGAGIDLKTGTPTPEQIRDAVRAVLHEPAFRHNARRLQAEMSAHDGPAEAALLLERLAAERAPVYRGTALSQGVPDGHTSRQHAPTRNTWAAQKLQDAQRRRRSG